MCLFVCLLFSSAVSCSFGRPTMHCSWSAVCSKCSSERWARRNCTSSSPTRRGRQTPQEVSAVKVHAKVVEIIRKWLILLSMPYKCTCFHCSHIDFWLNAVTGGPLSSLFHVKCAYQDYANSWIEHNWFNINWLIDLTTRTTWNNVKTVNNYY